MYYNGGIKNLHGIYNGGIKNLHGIMYYNGGIKNLHGIMYLSKINSTKYALRKSCDYFTGFLNFC